MRRILGSVCVVLFLSSCGHDPQGVRVYHYGLSDGGSNNGIHTVHQGDTLWSISKRYDVPLRDLMDVNKVAPPYLLANGQRLLLPAPNTYEVRQGDSLYAVSRMFKISITDLSRLNKLQSPYVIHPGQVLRVPSSSPHVTFDGNDSDVATYVPSTRQQQGEGAALPSKKPVYTKSKYAAKANVKSPAPRSSSRFMDPVSNGRIISGYGPKKDSLHNDGINIAAARGASVRSAENGIVVYASDELTGYGNLVLVKHADRYVTAYAHMDKLIANKGQAVKRGEVIGTVGSTGSVKTPQLHFEVRRGSKALDPSKYIEK